MSAEPVYVENLGRDEIHFPEVVPVREDGKKVGGAVKPFKLDLGSQDDNNPEARDGGVLQPRQQVPKWALDQLRKTPYFQHLENTHKIAVTIPA